RTEAVVIENRPPTPGAPASSTDRSSHAAPSSSTRNRAEGRNETAIPAPKPAPGIDPASPTSPAASPTQRRPLDEAPPVPPVSPVVVDVDVDVDVDGDGDGDVFPRAGPGAVTGSGSGSEEEENCETTSPRTALNARIAAAPSTASSHVLAANARRPSPRACRTRTSTSSRAPARATSTSASTSRPRSPAMASTRAARSGAAAHSAGPTHAIRVPVPAGAAARDGTLTTTVASKTIENRSLRSIVREPYASHTPTRTAHVDARTFTRPRCAQRGANA
ncbi:MAG: hypothetical protein JWM74_2425, partial [Myxococcaceae bacterium]|nr:hypothetical protein [Myxococcaceae bacterium]